MPELSQNKYDAVIIGAGIGGLVCGCYLAKAGMKVLIAEQHHKPGGYCTSFKRQGFTFDAAAHSFGSFREGGTINRIFRDLGLHGRITIKRHDPADIIITPDYEISFWADADKTIQGLQSAFPKEKKIRKFMQFISNPGAAEIAALRKKRFGDVLNSYFEDQKIKSILAFPIFGNGGLPPATMSAFTGSKIFTEFLVDGGYYPEGGMQALPDLFAMRFRELGGEICYSNGVTRFVIKDRTIVGVVLEKGNTAQTDYVISNCDARQTFLKLLGPRRIPELVREKLKTMTPSLSMFIIYLGIDRNFSALPKPCTTAWYLPNYDLEGLYDKARKGRGCDLTKYLLRVSADGRSILAMTNTSFKNPSFWQRNKYPLLDSFIDTIEKTSVPNLSGHVVYKEAATPQTLLRYTLNSQGAAYGWESTPLQFIDADFRKPSFVHNLYLTGHWTTYAQGVAGVAYLGSDTARAVLRNSKRYDKV